MEIRSLRAEDLEALAGLYAQFWGETSDVDRMREAFARLREDSRYIFLAAVEARTLVGSVMGVVCEELYGDCRPFLVLEDMIVDRAWRGKGVGRLLIEALEDGAREKGCAQVILVTEAARKDACGFYEAMGFHPTAHRGFKKGL